MMIFKGGTTRFVGSFYTVAILKGGGAKMFQHKKGERENFHPVFRGGGDKKSWTLYFPFFNPPPLINDHSIINIISLILYILVLSYNANSAIMYKC